MAEKSIVKNYLFNLVKTFCSMLFPLITFSYSSRVLGADGVGRINFAKSIITYFSMIAMLGINQYGTREASKVREDRAKLSQFVKEVFIVNFFTTMLAYILLAMAILFVNKLQNYTILLWINSFSIAMSGMGMEWLYQAVEEYEYIAKRFIFFQIISLILMFIFVHDRNDVVLYSIINVISSSGSYILNFFSAKKFIDIKQFVGKYEFEKHIKGMLWLFAMGVSVEIYTVLDTTMIGFLCGDKSVGLYTAAIKVIRMVNSLITSLGVVLIPRLSYYIGQSDNKKLQGLIDKGYNYVFLLSIPAAIGVFVLSDDIIMLFSGLDYSSAGLTMRIMACTVIVIPFSVMTNNQIFVPMGKEKLILISTCVGAISNFICNTFLIPRLAENGAAIGTIVAETTVALVCLFNAIRVLDMRNVFNKYWEYWAAALPILLVTFFIKKIGFNYILEIGMIICISCIVYIGILYLFKNEYLVSALEKIFIKLKKK